MHINMIVTKIKAYVLKTYAFYKLQGFDYSVMITTEEASNTPFVEVPTTLTVLPTLMLESLESLPVIELYILIY